MGVVGMYFEQQKCVQEGAGEGTRLIFG
jgi:hypothetical protein